MKETIKFAASNVDYDWASFNVVITATGLRVHVHFFGDAELWAGFGRQLQNFPQQLAARVIVESESCADDYLLLEACCYDALGHTALRVVTDHNAPEPSRRRIEFSIVAEAASINYSGRLLASWQIADNTAITWQAQTS